MGGSFRWIEGGQEGGNVGDGRGMEGLLDGLGYTSTRYDRVMQEESWVGE